MKVIKRYKNRKLYDTETSKYINLLDVIYLSVYTNEFKIVDNDTKTDITNKTLLLAFASHAKVDTNALRSMIAIYAESAVEHL